MNIPRPWPRLLYVAALAAFAPAGSMVRAVSFNDDFDAAHDYLANGVAGTIWDGLYTGAGSFPNGNVGIAPGTTFVANANITGAGKLTVQGANTGWDNAEDDGFFLFKNLAGDFQVSVHVVSPFANTDYNTAGLMIRAAEPGGAPWNGAENSVSLTRFDKFGIANYIRNTINGVTAQKPLPGVNDPNYWLRIDRVNGTTFNFYQRALASDPWQLIAGSSVTRPDFAGLTLQVGIEHASFTDVHNQAQFETFRLSEVPEPGALAIVCLALATKMMMRLKGEGPNSP